MNENLFTDGFSLDNFIEISSKSERERFFEVEKNIHFSDDILEKIKSVNEKKYIVASVETWCPYARAFTATMKKLVELNSNIKISFVTMGRGLFEIAEVLEIEEDDFVVPTAIVLDKDFNLINSFIGFPKKYGETGLGSSKNDYFDGLKADEIIIDIL